MDYTFTPSGVCSTKISFSIKDGILSNVDVSSGCDGNKKGIASLVEGMEAEKVVSCLSGIKCRDKATSCPDQLARSIAQALSEQ